MAPSGQPEKLLERQIFSHSTSDLHKVQWGPVVCDVISPLGDFNVQLAWETLYFRTFVRSFCKGIWGQSCGEKWHIPLTLRTPEEGLAALCDFCVGLSDGHFAMDWRHYPEESQNSRSVWKWKSVLGKWLGGESAYHARMGSELGFQHPCKSQAWSSVTSKRAVLR